MQKILSSEGLNHLRVLVAEKGALEAMLNGVTLDVSSCETEVAKSLPLNMPLLQVSNPIGDARVDDDAENAVRLHRGLSGLTPRAAANPRLWTTFSFNFYQDYMYKRWPLADAKDESKAIDKINDRFFLKRIGHKGYFRHGIARLWWTAHLTADTSQSDLEECYKFTRFAFSRQEYQFGIFLRKFGASYHVARSILEFFLLNEGRILSAIEATHESGKGFVDFIRHANKKMNIYGSVYVLDVLDRDQIHRLMERDAASFYGRYWA